MPRISGINLPENKKIEFALCYIFGIGPSVSKIILKSAKIPVDKKSNELTSEEVSRIQAVIDNNYKVEGELKREIGDNIKRLKEISSWRGVRHARRLPTHGRTKTNSRTLRGNIRRTMGSGRKPSSQKT
jgi:small subunit ribosomal protein S13